jgi:hypothetical protein
VPGAKIVAEAIKATMCAPAIILASFSCPSDFQSTAVVCYYPQDMRALSVTNVMGNDIGKEQLAKLLEIMRSKPNLVSLCGIADDATEADLAGLNMDAGGAAVLASELPDKGALTGLNISNNKIGTLVLPEGVSLPDGWSGPDSDGEYMKPGGS